MKIIFSFIALAALSLVGYLAVRIANSSQGDQVSAVGSSTSNVSMDGDRQIVEITAKGGYLPRMSTVKAGVPTVLRFNTKGTFDCSSSVRIPSLNISQVLPASGSTDIALGALVEGVLKGTCGMGMYPFELNVQS